MHPLRSLARYAVALAAVPALCLAVLVLLPAAAGAVPIRVTWEADVSGGAGNGTVSGALGVFEVTTGTELFTNLFLSPVPSEVGAIDVAGVSAALDGAYPMAGSNGSLAFQFTSFGSGHLIDFLELLLGDPETSTFFYSPDGTTGGSDSLVLLRDKLSNGSDPADVVILCLTGGIGCDPAFGPLNPATTSTGTPVFSFTVVPEPSTAVLLGAGILGLSLRRRAQGGVRRRRAQLSGVAAVLMAGLVLAGCSGSDGAPDFDAARGAIEARILEGTENAAEVLTLEKADATDGEVNGVKVQRIDFTGTLRATEALHQRGDGSCAFSRKRMPALMRCSDVPRELAAGTVYPFTGAVGFVRKDSGWVAEKPVFKVAASQE